MDRVTLASAEATGVLGEYKHEMTLHNGSNFAIIYGPNGVGKTKFLEIIHAMMNLDGRALKRIPFESARLDFTDGSRLEVNRISSDAEQTPQDKPQPSDEVRFHLRSGKKNAEDWIFAADTFQDWLVEHSPWRPIDDREAIWEDMRDGEITSLDELRQQYPNATSTEREVPELYIEFSQRMSSHLIETQRLRIERTQEARWQRYPHRMARRQGRESRIAEQAEKMRSLINDAQTEHSTITQQLDRTFPNRVLENTSPLPKVEDVRVRYEDQNAFRSRLGPVASVELAEAPSLPDRALEPLELRLLSLYLDDADKKLEPFVDLLKKIKLLEEIVNSRLLRKQLRVTAKEGLTVRHDSDHRRLDLDSLSSGEQHEVILMFDLLFNVPDGSLVMIDEPEISLHVVWQMAFIPDVQRIAELAGFHFVVATHSPQIINDKWDRAIPLGPRGVPFE